MEKEQNKKEKKNEDSEKLELHASEEQGILPEETSEEKKEAMEHGEKDEDIYSKEGREKLEEDGEISPEEEGFMEGASQAGQLGKDALTGEPLMDVENVVEAEIKGKSYRFVNEENAQKFREQKENEE
jgi:hypothetical protein